MTNNPIDYIRYRPLYNACAQGNWDAAQAFAISNPAIWRTQIDPMGSTPLCVAAISGQTSFIEKLVEIMGDEDLQHQDHSGYTALHNIATNGNTKAAKILVTKNQSLTGIQNEQGETPLLRAAIFGHEELLRYLKDATRDDDPPNNSPFRGANGASLLNTVIDADLYDVALELVKKHPEIATTGNTREQFVETESRGQQRRFAILALATKSWPSNISQARKPLWLHYAIPMLVKWDGVIAKALKQLVLVKWDGVIANALKQLASSIVDSHANNIRYKQYLELVEHICKDVISPDLNKISEVLYEIVLEASKHGNIDFIKSIIRVDHKQIMAANNSSLSMLHNAIKHRQKEVFYYLKDSGFKDELALKIDDASQETILHLAAKMSPPHKLKEIPSAALQVQHELRWYKEVEKIVQPFYRDKKDIAGKSPREMFTEEHQDLVQKGEKWMKNMAKSSMLVGTLIATVVFAAAFTVPGSTDQNKGSPLFLSKRAYMVFAVSNAFAFFSSLTSVLMFLAILTARYAEDDFLKSLPQRLIIGLVMLFFAIATMTSAFIATYFLMLGYKRAWISILLTVLVCVPVILFACFQFRLFFRMLKSTYRSTL